MIDDDTRVSVTIPNARSLTVAQVYEKQREAIAQMEPQGWKYFFTVWGDDVVVHFHQPRKDNDAGA